jgi:serine/threonine-protein kinase RsbW
VTAFQRDIPASLDEVPALSTRLRELCAHDGFSEIEASMIELAVVEAITNVIEHAYHGRPDGIVGVSASIDERGVRIEVADTGEAPDPARLVATDQPDPDPLDRESLAEGGRGLGIIRGVFDEVTFARHGNRNTLVMTKRRPGSR